MTGHDAHEWDGLTADEILDEIRRKLSEPGEEWVRFESVMAHRPIDEESDDKCEDGRK